MLVQMNLSEVESATNYVGEAYCQWCGKLVGKLDRDELNHLLFDSSRPLICFQCEDLKHKKWSELSSVKARKLMELYNVTSEKMLPVNSVTCWWSAYYPVHFQFWAGKGWLLWCPDECGEMSFWGASIAPERVAQMVRQLEMSPGQLV